MAMTRKLLLCKMRWTSAISLASRLTTFLFHRERSSTNPMPNSREAIWQAWAKSWESSSVTTASFIDIYKLQEKQLQDSCKLQVPGSQLQAGGAGFYLMCTPYKHSLPPQPLNSYHCSRAS